MKQYATVIFLKLEHTILHDAGLDDQLRGPRDATASWRSLSTGSSQPRSPPYNKIIQVPKVNCTTGWY